MENSHPRHRENWNVHHPRHHATFQVEIMAEWLPITTWNSAAVFLIPATITSGSMGLQWMRCVCKFACNLPRRWKSPPPSWRGCRPTPSCVRPSGFDVTCYFWAHFRLWIRDLPEWTGPNDQRDQSAGGVGFDMSTMPDAVTMSCQNSI